MKKAIIPLILLCLAFSFNESKVKDSEEVAKIISFNGIVLFRGQDDFYWQDVKLSTKLNLKDEIKTATASVCELELTNGSIIKIEPNSNMLFGEIKDKKVNRNISLVIGKIWVKASKKTDPVFYKTPYASICIKGTLFSIDAPYGLVSVYEGTVELSDMEKTISLKKGTEVKILETGLMDKPTVLSKETLDNYDNFMANTSISFEELQNIKKDLNIKPTAVNTTNNEQKKTFFSKFKDFLRI